MTVSSAASIPRIPTSSTRSRRRATRRASTCAPDISVNIIPRTEQRLRNAAGRHRRRGAHRQHRARRRRQRGNARGPSGGATSGRAPAGAAPAGAAPAGGQQGAGRGGRGAAGGGRGGAAQRLGRWHWDTPLIISPHAARRLYFAGDRVYRSDDRGDTWTAVSGDLTRNLDRTKIPIMGKVWPADSVAYMEATTRLSTITALDESPLLEGLLYVGTDDGLIQVSEDERQELAQAGSDPGCARIHLRHRRAGLVARRQYGLRDAQRLEPRQLQAVRVRRARTAARRGRRSRPTCRSAPARGRSCRTRSMANLLFVGMEFGLYATVDGGGALGEDGRRAERAGPRRHHPEA